MDIGKRIRQLRIKNDLTLEELASRTELTKGFLSQLERNLASPSIQTLEDITEALGTTMSTFFAEEDDSKVVFTPSAPDVLKLKTRPQFRKDILFKNVKPEMLEAYPETLSIRDLYHLAIDYSDALFFTPESADDELAAYAASKGVPAFGPFDIYANGLEGLYEIFDKLG